MKSEIQTALQNITIGLDSSVGNKQYHIQLEADLRLVRETLEAQEAEIVRLHSTITSQEEKIPSFEKSLEEPKE